MRARAEARWDGRWLFVLPDSYSHTARGFTYKSSQSSVIDKVMYEPALHGCPHGHSGISCARREVDTGVQYMGGGPINMQSSELWIGLPPHILGFLTNS